MGTTSKMSMPTLELWFSCFTKPLSMMNLQEEMNSSRRREEQMLEDGAAA